MNRPYLANRYCDSDFCHFGYVRPKRLHDLHTVGVINDRQLFDSLSGWRPNDSLRKVTTGLQVVTLITRISQDEPDAVYRNLSQHSFPHGSSWIELRLAFESFLRSQIKTYGYVEVHGQLLSLVDFLWAQAIVNVRQELGIACRNDLVRTDSTYAKLIGSYQARSKSDQRSAAWLRREENRLGANKIRFVLHLPFDSQGMQLGPRSFKRWSFYYFLSKADQIFSEAESISDTTALAIYENCERTMLLNAGAILLVDASDGDRSSKTLRHLHELTTSPVTVFNANNYGIKDRQGLKV